MKTINAQKLEGMGIERARAACMIHALKALKSLEHGDTPAFERHTSLLDQCAVVGRRLLNKPETTEHTAMKLLC